MKIIIYIYIIIYKNFKIKTIVKKKNKIKFFLILKQTFYINFNAKISFLIICNTDNFSFIKLCIKINKIRQNYIVF